MIHTWARAEDLPHLDKCGNCGLYRDVHANGAVYYSYEPLPGLTWLTFAPECDATPGP